MVRIIAVFLTIAVLALPGAAAAGGSSLEIGLGYHYFDYQEELNPPFRSTEIGWLPSIHLSYAYQSPALIYTRVFVDFAGGDVTFDGTTQGGTPIRFTDSRQQFFKFEWNIGYPFQVTENFRLIPFVGYGYRYWLRGKPMATATFRTFEEEYSWSYVPIGLKAECDLGNRWSVGATLAVNLMFNGKMEARFSQVLAGANDLEFDLGNRPGFYAELPVTYRFTKNWAVVGTPWYEHSEIGRSNTLDIVQNNAIVGFAFEPASRTHQYGFRLAASYSF